MFKKMLAVMLVAMAACSSVDERGPAHVESCMAQSHCELETDEAKRALCLDMCWRFARAHYDVRLDEIPAAIRKNVEEERRALQPSVDDVSPASSPISCDCAMWGTVPLFGKHPIKHTKSQIASSGLAVAEACYQELAQKIVDMGGITGRRIGAACNNGESFPQN